MTPRSSRQAALVASVATALALATPVAAPAADRPGTDRPAADRSPVARADCDPFGAPVVDPDVPTASEVLGLDLGDRDVTTEESDRYLQAVADASPRVVDGVLGRSWNGRPLRYAVVGRSKWVEPGALRAIGRRLNRLRDADTSAVRAERIVARTPAVLWVAGNVHGDEESGADASLRVLHELASRTDCAVDRILDRAVVVVLPVQNPDGREADTRRNAYGFDLNRDWFARTQRETDGKVAKLRELPPQLFIDAHEMGRATYFFPPNADPVYHDIGETPLHWIYEVYGPAMQEAFARFEIPYFNGDIYDLFYMGYGDTVPTTGFNAAGMTFEKANGDPTDVRVREQYTAIWATLSAAGERESLLAEWRREHVRAARQGRQGRLEENRLYYEGEGIENDVPDRRVRHYFLRPVSAAKRPELHRLVERLQGMDVEVHRLTRRLEVPDFKPYGRSRRAVTLPRGTYWVPMAQGQKHWVQAMLNEDTYVPFPYFYDVTAFSGPLLNNVPGGYSGRRLEPQARLVEPADVRADRAAERVSDRVAGAPRVAVWQTSEVTRSAIESAGWLRWWLDRRLELVYADVTADDIASGGLESTDVLVVPNGSADEAEAALGDAGRQALTDWVDAGGTLVTLRTSSLLASRFGLTTATVAEPTSDIPGSLVRVQLDARSPLRDGVGRTAYAMYEYDLVWDAPADATPVRYPMAGDPDWFVSGFAEGEEQLHGTAAVVDQAYGDGRVVLFGFDPNYRAFTDGTQQVLRNALLGPEPEGLDPVAPRLARRLAERSGSDTVAPVGDRMVLSVRPAAATAVQALLDERGARAEVTRSPGRVAFAVDLGGLGADEHPWAVTLAGDVAALGDEVLAVRLP